jgi:hypothetical protein
VSRPAFSLYGSARLGDIPSPSNPAALRPATLTTWIPDRMHLTVKTSPGEFLDKLTILEIKSERIHDPEKLRNVRRELELLRADWAASPLSATDVSALVRELKTLNETLWDVEDRIRAKEAKGVFDAEFVQLARAIYRTNDRRAAIKRRLNLALGSDLIEEKSYSDYGQG